MRKRRVPNSPKQKQEFDDLKEQELNIREFKEEYERKTLKFPVLCEAFYVIVKESDERGYHNEIFGKFESKTVHSKEEMNAFGNRAKTEAANCDYFNVMIVTVDADGNAKSIVYPRKVPKHIENVTDLKKTSDERMEDLVDTALRKMEAQNKGAGDFDKKPDAEHVMEHISKEDEDE